MLTKLKHYATRIDFEGVLARLMVVVARRPHRSQPRAELMEQKEDS